MKGQITENFQGLNISNENLEKLKKLTGGKGSDFNRHSKSIDKIFYLFMQSCTKEGEILIDEIDVYNFYETKQILEVIQDIFTDKNNSLNISTI